jgi:cytochrome P450
MIPCSHESINRRSNDYRCVLQTSSGTLWALYCLANNPEAQAKLYEETKRVLPNNETITPEKLSQLQYVKAVMKETFR